MEAKDSDVDGFTLLERDDVDSDVEGIDDVGAARAERADGVAPRNHHLRPAGRPLLCVSDIHGDLAALDAVLAAVGGVGELCGVVAAGDHCLGGPDPFGVWRRLQEIGAHMVRGTSDLALGLPLLSRTGAAKSASEEARRLTFLRTRQALGEVVCRRLAELPTTLVVSLDDRSGVMVMHGSPSDEWRGLHDDEHLPFEVGCVAEDVLVVGGTHRAFARRIDGGPLVVNAGSVGASPLRTAQGGRTAHAVLVVPCVDGRVRAWGRDVVLGEQSAVRVAG